jgi:predicted ATPase
MGKRIVIEGPSGSGKTTTLVGKSHLESFRKADNSLRDRGYNVLGETIAGVFRQMRTEDLPPFENIKEAMSRIAREEKRRFDESQRDGLYFFDRGLLGYELFAQIYGADLDDLFLSTRDSLRYSSPVFVFQPLESLDLSVPLTSGEGNRIYTLEQRWERYHDTVEIYGRNGYEVVEVPVLSLDRKQCIDQRIDLILKEIGSK